MNAQTDVLLEVEAVDLGQQPADDDYFRIEQIDGSGQLPSEFLSHGAHNFHRQRILLSDGVKDILQRQGISHPDLGGEDGGFPFLDPLGHFADDGPARNLGLQTPLLAAMAEDVVVVSVHVPEFARVAVFPVIKLSIENQPQSQSHSDVEEADVLILALEPEDVFSIGHGAG